MAQDKRIFTGGMDKDSEPRLIKNGDYRHAENIRNVASSDGTSGSVENIEGTEEVIHNFPGSEINEITTHDESGFITDVEPSSTLYSQKIILTGRELNGFKYNFTIVNHIDSNGTLSDEGITLDWYGNSAGTNTTEYLFGKFGPGGSLSENITIVNKNTGDLSTAHVNQETLNFNSGVPSMSTGGFILEIEIIADNPGIDFELNFFSSYSAETNQTWSSTISSLHPDGHLFIQNAGTMILSSAYDFGVTDAVNDLTSEDGSPIGDFPSSSDGVTQILLEFEGVEPTTPENVTGTTIFSYNENADGSFNVLPFAEIGSGKFDTGDEYEFDASQNNIAEALVDKFTNFESPVLETSLGQQILLRSRYNIITGFNQSTRLNSVRPKSSDTEGADSSFYYLLKNYVSKIDLVPLNLPSEATLEGNVYTITGRSVTAKEEFFFPANIVKGKSYRIQGVLTTMVASNSISFKLGKLISQPFSTQGQSIECTFTAEENVNKFSFVIDNAFTTDTDKVEITGLTISEYEEPNSKLQVLIQGSRRYDFNLCFGTSEEQVKKNLEDGLPPEASIRFIDGSVGAKLIPYSSTGVGLNDNVDIVALEQLIASLENTITTLEAEISNLTLEHIDALDALQADFDADSTQAAADLATLQAELDTLITANDVLQTEYDSVNLQLTEALASANTNAQDIVSLNNLINELDLEIQGLETAVANAVGSNLITNGGFDNETLDGTQGWLPHPDASSGSVSISGGVLNLDRPRIPESGEVTAVQAYTSDESSSIVESGKFYRLSFDIVSVVGSTGDPTSAEMKYFNGATYVSLGTGFTTGNSVIEYYEAAGTSLFITNHTKEVNVSIDNVVLEEISLATINDFLDLENQLDAAETAATEAQDELTVVNQSLSDTDINWANAYNNILSTLDSLLGTSSSSVGILEGITVTDSDLQDSISEITTEINDIISNTTSLADSIGVNYNTELTISENISSLNNNIQSLISQVDAFTLPDYSSTSSSDINAAVTTYNTAVQNALDTADQSLLEAQTLNDELNAQTDSDQETIDANTELISTLETSIEEFEAQLDSIQIINSSGGVVSQEDYDTLVAENENLEFFNVAFQAQIGDLSAANVQNNQNNQALAADVTLLWGYIESLLTGVSIYQDISNETIENLSSISNITQGDIDNFVSSFNDVTDQLNNQISTLEETLNNALAEVTTTFDFDSSSANDKYIFTYVGNIPDLNTRSIADIFRNSYVNNYGYGLGIGHLAISRISNDFSEAVSINSNDIISSSNQPGLVSIIANSAGSNLFHDNNYGFSASYNSLIGNNAPSNTILSPDFTFVKYPDQNAILIYKYNVSADEFESYKITYLTGGELIHNNTFPNNSSNAVGEAGGQLDSENVSTWLENQTFTSGSITKPITHGTQVQIEVLSGSTTGFYINGSLEENVIVGPNNPNAVYTLASFPEVENTILSSNNLASGSLYPDADNRALRSLRLDCFVEYIAGDSTIEENPEESDITRTHEGSTRKMIKSFSTGITTTTSIDSSMFNWKCVGSYEDKPKSRVYYFICSKDINSRKQDCILEYDLLKDKIVTVYQDGRPSTTGTPNNILNFSQKFLITGINKVDDILYWTDNFNRPRKINVELAKANEVNIKNATTFEDVYYNNNQSSVFIGVSDNHGFEIGDHIYTQINQSTPLPGVEGNNGYTKVTGVIPKLKDGVTLKVTQGDAAVVVYGADGNPTDDFGDLSAGQFIGIEEMISGTSTNFPYYYEVASVSGSTITLTTPYNQETTSSAPFANPLQNQSDINVGGLITECPWAGTFTALPGVILHVNPEGAYSPLVSFGDTIEKAKYLDAVKYQPTHKPTTELSVDSDIATNNILDNVFQFKYRYLHVDEEFTSYSPISDVFIDPAFALNSVVSASNYLDMANKISITYDDATPDVDTIEIVARKGNDGEFFLVDTIPNNFITYLKKLKNEVIANSEYEYTDLDSVLSFYNNGTYPFVDKVDSDKLYDAVPKKAKAQTILSNNRIAYGNVVEGYDNTKMIIKSNFTNDGSVTLTSDSTSIPVLSGWLDDMTNFFDFSVDGPGIVGQFQIAGGSSHTRHTIKFDLSSLSLSSDINQQLMINYSWSFNKGGVDRDGSYSTGPLDVTGFTSIDQVGTFLQAYVSDDFNSVEFIGNNGSSITSSYSSSAKTLTIEFNYGPNADGTLVFNLNNGDFSSTNNSTFTQGDGGLSSFKTGAFHNFGVAYFDETNRCSFVNVAPDYGFVQVDNPTTGGEDLFGVNFNGTRPYNKFYSETSGPDLSESSSVNFNIYNKPPRWATHYQMYYTGNTTVDEFIQMTVVNAKVSDDSNDKQIYLSLQSLKGEGWSYNESNNSQLDYNFVKGDRVRFISFDPGSGREKFTEYVDLEIAGDDLYVGEDGEPFNASSDPISGFYIRINDPESTSVNTGSGPVDLSHAGVSTTVDGTGYENLIVEIYRPKRNLDEDLMVYYEIGEKYPIINAGKGNRSHSGDADQTSDYTFNKELNVDISSTPSSINIKSGDIYLKARTMSTSTTGASSETFFPEDYYLNDFHRTNHYSKGRINVINNNAAERHLEASVYYSETYSSTGSINGLSNFNLANIPYYDYNKNFGSIQSLMMKDDDLLIFHENKVGRVLVQKDILTTASGEGLVSLSNRVIDNYVSLYSGEYGCCLQPESISKFGNRFYFVDIKRGSVLRLSNDGLTVISDQGMRDYFRDLGEMYVINDPENQKENVFNIVAGYDPKYDEYIVTFPDVYEANQYSWGNGKTFWDSDYETYRSKSNRLKKIFSAKTIAFNERTNRWTSFYDFYPDYYARVGRQFIGFKNGRLYKHNMTDRGYQKLHTGPGNWQYKYNHLYDAQYDSTIQFPFNIEPSSVKSYNAISLESDSKFFTSMYTNIGQTVGGGLGLLEMGYDTTIDTEIGYKKVDGLINNYDEGVVEDTRIFGTDTKFFEDVKKGDIVRIWGTTPEGGYTSVTRLISAVVSNSILRLSDHATLILENSYMEVIDYKTKEGVQYANIPFVESNPRGDVALSYTNEHGDGSEFFGVGSVNEPSSTVISNNLGSLTGAPGYSLINPAKVKPSSMIVGAEYALYSLGDSDVSSLSQFGVTSVGDVFTYTKKASFDAIEDNNISVISTDYKLYLQKEDGSTVFLGYAWGRGTTVHFVKAESYSPPVDIIGFLFIVKNGNVEGERMKGQYMMTTLTTNSSDIYSGEAYASRYKFNLYAANADVDKSELSNK